MRQFVLPADYSGTGTYLLRGERRHYLLNVLRLKEGDRFPGLDSQGGPVDIELERIENDACRLAVYPQAAAKADRPPSQAAGAVPAGPRVRRAPKGRDESEPPAQEERITVFQCVPKGKKMDLIVRQATEAGVARIVPVMSRHTVPRYDEHDWRNKRDRWSRVIREAVQQCGRKTVPELCEPITIESIPSSWANAGPGIFFHEKPLAHETLHEYLFGETPDIALVVGPEGGLAPAETESLRDAGFGAVYLGENVLRVETATLFAIAAVRIVLLEKYKWKLNDR